MQRISLSQGKVTLIDDEDFEKVNQYKWCVGKDEKSNKKYYVIRTCCVNQIEKTIKLHRFIMNPPNDMQVDHINGNTLDNRKSNLRICSHSENSRNRLKHKNNTSEFKGVAWDDSRKKWRAQITVDYKTINLGRYVDKKDAALAYNWGASLLHKGFANLNKFPEATCN